LTFVKVTVDKRESDSERGVTEVTTTKKKIKELTPERIVRWKDSRYLKLFD